jgi:hypothetical protein
MKKKSQMSRKAVKHGKRPNIKTVTFTLKGTRPLISKNFEALRKRLQHGCCR